MIDYLINYKNVKGIKKEHFNGFFSCSAVKHLFAVATGIDSLILGDSQILGQVKEAIEISEELKFVGKTFRRLLDTSVRAW